MINASAANALTLESATVIGRITDDIGLLVESKARAGEYDLKLNGSYSGCQLGLHELVNGYNTTESAEAKQIKVLMARVREELMRNGYKVVELTDDPYVPRGLSDDAGKGPQYRHRYLAISWYKK